MILESRNLIETLRSHLNHEELMTPSKALQTLYQAKQQFGLSVLHKMGLSGSSIPEELLESRLRQIFRDFDTDASDSIDCNELASAMALLGIVATDKVLETLLRAADADGNGTVNFAEFKALVTSVLSDSRIYITRRLRVHSTLIPAPSAVPLSAAPPQAALRIQRRRSSVVRAGGSPDASPLAASAPPRDRQPSPARALVLHTPGQRRLSGHGKGLALRRRKSSLSLVAALAASRRSSIAVTVAPDDPGPHASPDAGRLAGYSHLRTGARALRH